MTTLGLSTSKCGLIVDIVGDRIQTRVKECAIELEDTWSKTMTKRDREK